MVKAGWVKTEHSCSAGFYNEWKSPDGQTFRGEDNQIFAPESAINKFSEEESKGK